MQEGHDLFPKALYFGAGPYEVEERARFKAAHWACGGLISIASG